MRYKRVAVSGAIFESILRQDEVTNIKCIKGLPHGAKFVYATPGHIMGLAMIFEHESWEEIEPGKMIPEFTNIEFARLD